MELILEDIILALFVMVGIIGTFMPAVPGTGIILAGALLYAYMTEFQTLTATTLAVLFGLFMVGGLGQYVITGLGARKMGSTKYGAFGAIGGFIIGLMLPIPGGIFVGSFLGAFLAEIFFAMKTIREGARSGAGAVLSSLASLFFEFFIAVAMVLIILFRIIRSHPSF